MEWILVGDIVREHGIAGEVNVRLYNPSSQVLSIGCTVEINGPECLHTTVRKMRQGPKGLLVQFEGLTSPEQAKEFRGATVAVDKSLITVAPGEFLLEDLKGFVLEDVSGNKLGVVEGFFAQGPSEWLVIGVAEGQTELLPLNPAWIKRIAKDDKKLVVDLPEGLWTSI